MLQSEPNNWEIFKIPSVQPIQYCSILKKKREFSQLIKQYDAQVRKYGCLHYCSIVPKSINSSISDKYELLIVFLGDVPNTSFIGFRISVSHETFIHENNSLLLFLKESRKAGLYFENNNCIHVQCGKYAWEIFYHLYETYMRKYVLTVIGTQFFYHFVYEACFQKEKQLLNMLFKGSKVIRVSKMSIYYRIHQKRKISVTDLIHMTLNMPKSKRCVISFDSKESLSHLNIGDQNMYTAVGSKIHVSKLVINKFKKQYHDSLPDNRYAEEIPLDTVPSPILNFHSKFASPEFKTHKKEIEKKQLIASSSVQKRKFEKTENECQMDFPPKFCKISDSNCLKEEIFWEQYASVKPYSIKSYSSIFPSKSIISDHFYSNKSCEVNSVSNLSCINISPCVPSSKSSLIPKKKCQNFSTVEKNCDIYKELNLNRNSQFDGNSMNTPCFREKTIMNSCKKNSCETNDFSESRPNTQLHHKENFSFQSLSFSKSTFAASPSKYIDQDEANEDGNFTTAAGKSVNISNKAMLAAQKFFQSMCHDETHQKSDRNAYCNPVENKDFMKVPALKKNSVISFAERTSKENEITSGEIDSKSTINKYDLGVSYDRDSVSFYTAAGKTINVSKAAMKAAHKLIQDAFETEDKIIPSSSSASSTCKKKLAFKNIDGPPKKFLIEDNDDTMDKALIEQFFQDAIFDEKKSEDITKSCEDTDFDKGQESKNNNNLATHKIRKSLGGRRNMRFYSDT